MVKKRGGSDSRCCNPSLAPLTWRDFTDTAHPAVAAFNVWLESLPRFARLHEEGEIDDLMEAAEAGLLEDSGDHRTLIKPIRRNPEIFELRRTALSKKLRFYHGEPRELPRHLVKLHRHIKLDDASQELEILHAAERYLSGRPASWLD